MSRWLTAVVIITAGCGRTEIYRAPGDQLIIDAGIAEDAGSDIDAGMVPCTPGRIALTPAVPVVMFVLDRSASMNTSFGAAGNRWQSLTAAFGQALPAADQTMQVGALVFPVGAGGQSCSAPGGANLSPAIGNVPALLRLMRVTSPAGSTPTSDAMDSAAAAVRGIRAAGTARALVLATDGAPDCNTALDPRTCVCVSNTGCTATRCLDDARTVDRIRALTASGLPTYVIGIQRESETALVAALNAMAVAGGRPRTGASQQYYPATSDAALQTALVTIRDQVKGCVFLTTSVPDAEGSFTLTLGDTPIVEDDSNGWRWSNRANGELLLSGEACALAERQAAPALTAIVACTDK